MTSIIVTGSEYDRVAAGQRTALIVKDGDWQAGDTIRIETAMTADKTGVNRVAAEIVSCILNTDVSDRPPLTRVITHVLRDATGLLPGSALVTFVDQQSGVRKRATKSPSRVAFTTGRPALTDDHYQAIADLYTSRGTVQAIADELDANYSTAARWVREARRRGMLPADRVASDPEA